MSQAPVASTSEPGDRPDQRHERERPHPAPAFDQVRERQLGEHDHAGVDREDEPDLALADAGVIARELGEEVHQRVSGGDEEEVQRPEAEEGLVPEDGAVARRRGTGGRLDAWVGDEREHGEVAR